MQPTSARWSEVESQAISAPALIEELSGSEELSAAALTSTSGWREVLKGCIEMTKYRLSSLVIVTAGAGYWLADPEAFALLPFAIAMACTVLAAFGANAMNQCLEVPLDRRMERTRERPLPSGRVPLAIGVAWALGLIVSGVGGLFLAGHPLSALLTLVVALLYVAAYTPLKQRTSLNTLVGAICGALPPMIGWAAATGMLAPGAWVLFGILFAWQIPHFLAIDWFHRADYARGGFRMASSVDPSGQFSAHQSVVYCLALIPISLMAPLTGMGGWVYFLGATMLGMGFLGLSLGLFVLRTRLAARRLFLGSLAYLPLLLGLLILDPTA